MPPIPPLARSLVAAVVGYAVVAVGTSLFSPADGTAWPLAPGVAAWSGLVAWLSALAGGLVAGWLGTPGRWPAWWGPAALVALETTVLVASGKGGDQPGWFVALSGLFLIAGIACGGGLRGWLGRQNLRPGRA
ncbi:MAG TPA: hypothetical protein VF017_16360 [Thermoanaerobaculia bacterium]|nr:hypothetical protein [Thermoanaerobaculia bacterium]